MSKKVSTALVAEAIMAEAKAIKRKREIVEELKKFNGELSALNEVGMVGSFGFADPNDASNKTKTGFAEPQQGLSFVKKLMDEFEQENKPAETPEAEDIKALKEAIETLKSENEELKKKLVPSA